MTNPKFLEQVSKLEIQAVDDIGLGLNLAGQEDELHTQAGILYYSPEAEFLCSLEN